MTLLYKKIFQGAKNPIPSLLCMLRLEILMRKIPIFVWLIPSSTLTKKCRKSGGHHACFLYIELCKSEDFKIWHYFRTEKQWFLTLMSDLFVVFSRIFFSHTLLLSQWDFFPWEIWVSFPKESHRQRVSTTFLTWKKSHNLFLCISWWGLNLEAWRRSNYRKGLYSLQNTVSNSSWELQWHS